MSVNPFQHETTTEWNVRFNLICLLAVCLSLSGSAAHAQKKTDPRVRFVHPGADSILNDVKILFSLTTAAEQKQEVNLTEFIDTFLAGVDSTRFIGVNLLFGSKGVRYVLNFPITDLKKFRRNIDDFGVASKPKGKDVYQLSDEFDGWMSFRKLGSSTAGKGKGNVTIVEKAADLAGAANSAIGVDVLLKRGESLTFELANEMNDQASRDARRSSFAATRRELLAALKKKATESPAAFEVRKQGYINQLDELERLFVETSKFVAGWKYDPVTTSGKLSFDLLAIEGTQLAQAISEFGDQPCHFAGIAREDKSILSGRFMHPIDKMRKQALEKFLDKSLVSLTEQIETSELTSGEKSGATLFAKTSIKMLKVGVKGGSFDGFVEVMPTDGGNQIVGGVKTPVDLSADALEAIKGWAASRTGQILKQDIGREGDVTFHSIKLAINHSDIEKFIGSDQTVYLGVGPDTLWSAIGPNALEFLTKSIQATGSKATNQKTPDEKTTDQETTDVKATDEKPADEKTTDEKTTDEKTTDEKATDEKAIDKKPADEKTSDVKATDEKTNDEKTNDEKTTDGPTKAIDVRVRIHPWLTLLDQIRSKQPIPTTREGKTLRKEQAEQRAAVLAATKNGDDILAFEVHRNGDQITGTLSVVKGILRFVGKEVARFTKDNLDVGG
jgi:hypothetical protein